MWTLLKIIWILFIPGMFLGQEVQRGAAIWPGKTKTLVYKTISGQDLKLDVLYPDSIQETSAPVHVFMHGGGWRGGWRQSFDQPEQIKVFEFLAEKGFIGVTIDYRLLQQGITLQHIVRDCKDAVRFLYREYEHLKIDPERMAVWGSSAGGHLALMAGLTEDDDFPGAADLADAPAAVRCIVSWYGVTDFVSPETSGSHIRGHDERFGADIDDNLHIRKLVSPINYLAVNSAPVLCIHGMEDDIVPFAQSMALLQKARRVGANVSLISVLNTGHGWSRENEALIPGSDDLAKITADYIHYYTTSSRNHY